MILSKHSETTSEIKVKPMLIQVDIKENFPLQMGERGGNKRGGTERTYKRSEKREAGRIERGAQRWS